MSFLDPSPKSFIRFHLTMMAAWALLLIPTLIWWKDSILWVAAMSLYANFVGHFSGYDAARAEASDEVAVVLAEVRALREEVAQLRAA